MQEKKKTSRFTFTANIFTDKNKNVGDTLNPTSMKTTHLVS